MFRLYPQRIAHNYTRALFQTLSFKSFSSNTNGYKKNVSIIMQNVLHKVFSLPFWIKDGSISGVPELAEYA